MKEFDVKKTVKECVDWIRDWFNNYGKDSPAVIGISGGKDSAVVATLCAMALGKDRVIGVQMPQGIQPDIADSDEIIKWLGIKSYCVNIGNAYKAIASQLDIIGLKDNSVANTNLPPRLRMAVIYAVSQRINGRVANTCNLSEDYIGWSTKWGDSCGDFSPISNLTCTEVIKIGEYLGIPNHLIYKTPSDGLCGKSDEEKFGFSYETLDNYIRDTEGEIDLDAPENSVIKDRIIPMHLSPNTRLKQYGIPSFVPSTLKWNGWNN